MEKSKLCKIIKRLQILVFLGTLAVSGLFTGTSFAKAEEVTIGYCELTIQQGVHTPNNRAQATGPCKGFEYGYYYEDASENYFVIDGLRLSIVDYDGQKFEMATPQYPILYLTVHIFKKGEQPTTNPTQSPKGWVKENGKWVYYNSQGKKQTGWLYSGSKWYFMDKQGYMKTGWIYDKAWYYLASSGAMKTGWQKVNGTWYYLANSGAMKAGWLYDNGWYLLADNGAMKTGWQLVNGTWYYFYSNGRMAANIWIGGFHLNNSGAWIK